MHSVTQGHSNRETPNDVSGKNTYEGISHYEESQIDCGLNHRHGLADFNKEVVGVLPSTSVGILIAVGGSMATQSFSLLRLSLVIS